MKGVRHAGITTICKKIKALSLYSKIIAEIDELFSLKE